MDKDNCTSRRNFLKAGAAAVSVPLQVGGTPKFSISTKGSFEATRQKAAHRRRRIIWNNDGDDCWLAKQPTAEAFLNVRLKPILDTQVDTVFYCTTQDVGYYTHRTKVAQHFTKPHPAIPISSKVRLTEALDKQGTDVLEVSVDYCPQQGKEIFLSHRMNGMEDMGHGVLLGDFKRTHRQWWLGKPEDEKKYPPSHHRHWYRVLDFAVPEIREYLLAIFQEVIGNYNIDGLELDYLRDPWLFKETFSDPVLPATEEHCQLMVEFHKKVCALLDAKSRRIGRPLLLALRVPHWLDVARYLGFDIEAYLKSSAVDLLVGGGGYTPFTMPPKDFISLAHKYDVPAYVCISRSGMLVRGGRKGSSRRESGEAYRGAATNLWDAGVDGQYTFNLFPEDIDEPPGYSSHLTLKVLREIGDPPTMAGKEMVFALDTWEDVSDHGWANPAFNRQGILPIALSEGLVWYYCEFYVGLDVSKLSNATASLRAWLRGVAAGDEVVLMLNGEPLQPLPVHPGSGEYTDYGVRPSQLRYRANRLGACAKRARGEKKDPIQLGLHGADGAAERRLTTQDWQGIRDALRGRSQEKLHFFNTPVQLV